VEAKVKKASREDQATLMISIGDKAEAIELEECVSPTGYTYYARPKTEDAVVFEDVMDRNEYGLPNRFEDDDVVIDVGAHIGGFSVAALRRGAGKVYAYEAHPINHAIACKNLARFGDLAACHNRAVWRSDLPTQTLYNDDLTDFASTGGISLLWNNEGVPIESVSLDEVLDEASDGFKKKIRLLKLDCEGSEYPILFTVSRLDIVEEICGEYHEIKPEVIPDRAKVEGKPTRFDRYALKEFLESKGWTVELVPKGNADGLFRALRKASPAYSRRQSTPALDVERLKEQIREAAALKQGESDSSLIEASAALSALLSERQVTANQVTTNQVTARRAPARQETLNHVTANHRPLFPEQIINPVIPPQEPFILSDDDRYHINDLLKYSDGEFVRNSYRAILKRWVDEAGYNHSLELLRSGKMDKIEFLAGLHASAEGRLRNVRVEGLAWPAALRRLYRLPVLGRFVLTLAGLAHLPAILRGHKINEHFRARLETELAKAHQSLAKLSQTQMELSQIQAEFSQTQAEFFQAQTELSQTQAELSQMQTELSQTLSDLDSMQRKVAEFQRNQIGALFREQQEMLKEQKTLRDEIYLRPLEFQEQVKRVAQEQLREAETLTEFVEDEIRGITQKLQQLRTDLVLNERRVARLLEEERSVSRSSAQLPVASVEGQYNLDSLYAYFENRFRGEAVEVKELLKVYLPFLRRAEIKTDILDLGTGRGDWLELLKEEGFEARGVEINRLMVEQSKERGLDVEEGDALRYLRALPAGSLSAVTAFHLIEHLPFEVLISLLDEILRALKPGGLVIFETPNPENVVTGSCNFYLDPTHRHPLPRELMHFVMQARGFHQLQILRLHPIDAMRIEDGTKLAARFSDHLYGPMDYAIIGRKA
jgi:FkbM family methyltransferase